MQSDEEDSALHSCFDSLKSAVMGCCYSICHKENDPQENTVNERTHLLEVPEQQQETPVPVVSASTPPRKPDEQSALNRILHETANNVIDVGALGPYALEPGAYSERVRAYTARVAAAPAPPPPAPPRLLADVSHAERSALLAKPALPPDDKDFVSGNLTDHLMISDTPSTPAPPRLLADVSHAERSALLAKPALPPDDKDFITNSVKKAAAAISELRVEHHEDLVVPFRVP